MSDGSRSEPYAIAKDLAIAAKNASAELRLGRRWWRGLALAALKLANAALGKGGVVSSVAARPPPPLRGPPPPEAPLQGEESARFFVIFMLSVVPDLRHPPAQ